MNKLRDCRGANRVTYPVRILHAALGVNKLIVGVLALQIDRRVIDHRHNRHGHVSPHDVRVRHAQEEHEGDEMPGAHAEESCKKNFM